MIESPRQYGIRKMQSSDVRTAETFCVSHRHRRYIYEGIGSARREERLMSSVFFWTLRIAAAVHIQLGREHTREQPKLMHPRVRRINRTHGRGGARGRKVTRAYTRNCARLHVVFRARKQGERSGEEGPTSLSPVSS